MSKSEPSRPDYAALIKAVAETSLTLPEWLEVGQAVYSPTYGFGQIMGVLGQRLIVDFDKSSEPISISNWSVAVEQRMLVKAADAPQPNQTPDLQQISHPIFQNIAEQLADNLVSIETILPTDGELHPLPSDLPAVLQSALKEMGITQIYSHQLESLMALRSGKDISILTPTASGKTWCFNIAVMESCLTSNAVALYLYPLKALASDQIGKLRSLVAALPADTQIKIGLMTGDTSMAERQRLFTPTPPQILGVSPDLLHYQLYSVCKKAEGEPFREFLRNLRWVVIDESHTYVGTFGANFANLMRRLRVAIDSVGGDSTKVQFVFSSATIGNPAEMALRFSGRETTPERLQLIDKSGAKSAGRTILSLKPSSTANPDAAKIILSLLDKELSGICFCNNRSSVKNLLGLIKQEARRQGCSHLAVSVAVFYGSLKSDRRSEIIQQLQSGKVRFILSTSALEAGLDLPELDCCLVRGWSGSLMSFRQRIGRAGRRSPGLVIFLPVAQSHLDNYYSANPDVMLHGAAESASFNPDYPVLLGKHLMASCVESGIPLAKLTHYFGERSLAIADALLNQNQLFLSRNGQIWGRGYPHKEISLRGNTSTSVKLIDSNTGEDFEEMDLAMSQREVFPGAIYTAQDADGQIIKYKSIELDIEARRAILSPINAKSNTFTIAETDLDIQMLEPLAEPKAIALSIPGGELKLTLAWGEITSLVTGYKLCIRQYELTCISRKCRNYHRSLSGKSCSACGQRLQSAELVTIIDEIPFDKPYHTQYKTPIVKVEINEAVRLAISAYIQQHKEQIRTTHESIPLELAPLWEAEARAIALHSIGHQIQFAVPLVVLSSSLDLNYLVTEAGGTVGYFYDSCADGNGCSEAIFHQFPKFATSAKSLALACNCEAGCPKCLYMHGCPQSNSALNKKVGLKLLEAIAARTNR